MQWTCLEDAEMLARTAAERIVQIAHKAIARRGCFTLVLAGGGTPMATYALLANERLDWSNWHIYFGDERCLPVDHPDRNSAMAKQTLLDRVPIPSGQIHPIPAELGAEQGADAYSEVIRSVMPFDLVLLGLGEDGHTASLFPGQQEAGPGLAIPVYQAPKPPAERISLTTEAIGNCRELLFLVSGSCKQAAVRRWRRGELLPVSRIHPQGESEVLIDQQAAAP